MKTDLSELQKEMKRNINNLVPPVKILPIFDLPSKGFFIGFCLAIVLESLLFRIFKVEEMNFKEIMVNRGILRNFGGLWEQGW